MGLKLRDYQRGAIDELYEWFRHHKEGNPCIVLPTGSGKSIIQAAFCQKAIQDNPGTHIILCTHQKELIQQDYDKLVSIWPEADVGIYSAGIGKKELNHVLIYAGIQSIWKHAAECGKVNLLIVDEAHLINSEEQGRYRKFIDRLRDENPRLRVIGMTATPYRLKQGRITDKPAIFSEPLIEPVSIRELQNAGYLSPLRSKRTTVQVSVEGVSKVGGDYNRKELEEAVNVPKVTEGVVDEIIERCEDRKHWLIFCAGVAHAASVCDMLIDRGIPANWISGDMKKDEREQILDDFKSGKIKALTNCNILTTGYDFPGIDLIALIRPTQSPGLYMQMVGRGLRIAPDKKDCLVLDFGGNIERHGPIHCVNLPHREKEGVAPVKCCPHCGEYIPMNSVICPACDYKFPIGEKKKEEKEYTYTGADINGETIDVALSSWMINTMTSKNGNLMVRITYIPQNFADCNTYADYFLLWSENDYVKDKAINKLKEIARMSGLRGRISQEGFECTNTGQCPKSIQVVKEGKFWQILNYKWGDLHG